MLEVKKSVNTDRAWALGLFAVGLVLGWTHLATVRDSPFFSILILDPRMYDDWAQRIANGESSGRPFFQDPLYAYFLGGLYALLGQRHLPVVAIQHVLGATVAPLVFLATRHGFGRTEARVAGLAAALYLPAVYYQGLILKSWLAMVLMALALWLIAKAILGAGRFSWFSVGLVLGLGVLTRGNLLLFLPVLALWVLLEAPITPSSPERRDESANPWRSRLRDRQAWSLVVALAIGSAAVIVPTAIRNRVVGGEWILTTSNAGQNFYIGNNVLNKSGEYQRLPFVKPNPMYEERAFADEARRRTGRSMSPHELSRFWFGEATQWIVAHPSDWIALLGRKSRILWAAYEIPDNLDYYLYRERAPVLRLPLPGFGVIAPLGLLGAVLAWRRRGWPRVLLLFLAVYSASVVLFFVFSRFRMPMMPALFPLAAFGAVELLRRSGEAAGDRTRWRAAAGALALAGLCFGFVNLPVRGSADSLTLRIARAAGLPRKVESSAVGHFNLGVAYAARAKDVSDAQPLLQLAEDELRLALESEDRFAQLPLELGKVLARQGKDGEAIELYRAALALEPGNVRARHGLGLLLKRSGRLDEAEASFRDALSLDPRHVQSAVRLGEVLFEIGRNEEAVELFRHALSLSPDNTAARDGLARAISARDP